MQKQKILIYDIETTPNLAFVWGKWEQNVIAFESEWKLLSFAVKWLGQSTTVYGTDTLSEKDLVKMLHTYLDDADIIIAHNGKRFDNKKANAKFIEFGLKPPSPYKVIDTLEVAKRYFSFNSNKLDDLGKLLKVGQKIKHSGFDLWLGCIQKDAKSWALMKKYNKQDVVLLEQIYLKLRPWIQNHPILSQELDCPNCMSKDLQRRGYSITKKFKFQRLQCNNCGTWTQIKC